MMKTRLVWAAVAVVVAALVVLLVACSQPVSDASTGHEQAGESPSWPTTLAQSRPRGGDPTFMVINTNDSNAGSLRQAILDSNGATDAGANTIDFAIPSTDPNCDDAGVCTIAPGSALPVITQPVTVDGYSQSGASQATNSSAASLKIVLNGASAGTADGLTITAGTSTVQGLVINGFNGNGIVLETLGSNTIAGNYIGTDVTGSSAVKNARAGVFVDGVANDTIGGTAASARNVISGNMLQGVLLQFAGATGNVVEGNYVGTNASGTSALANTNNGVEVSGAHNNTVGGTTAGSGNVISGNTGFGVELIGASNVVQGNLIGTNAAGTGAVPNSVDGLLIFTAAGNLVGGTASGAGNVISGNTQNGVHIKEPNSKNNVVQGNLIGTRADGLIALGNGANGVLVDVAASSNTIGGTATGARNVISANGQIVSANGQNGVFFNATNSNTLQGNFIGVGSDGTTSLGNTGNGVLVGGSSNTIGGTAAGAGNVIGDNVQDGISITGGSNSVLGNFIGVASNGSFPIGNLANGVLISGNSNIIGGTTAGAGNVIGQNTLVGVSISSSSNSVEGNFIGIAADLVTDIANGGDGVFVSSGNANLILTNSIDLNGGLGIDLAAGANNSQASPSLSSAKTSKKTNQTTVVGTLTSTASAMVTVQFFLSPTCDPSGSGEGRQFLAQALVATGSKGTAKFMQPFPRLPVGEVVTTTVTDPSNNTSAFSNCVTVK
jgi:titin